MLDLGVAEEADGEIVALAPEVELSQAQGVPEAEERVLLLRERHQLVLRGAHGDRRARGVHRRHRGRVRHHHSLSESQHRDEEGECAIADLRSENKDFRTPGASRAGGRARGRKIAAAKAS